MFPPEHKAILHDVPQEQNKEYLPGEQLCKIGDMFRKEHCGKLEESCRKSHPLKANVLVSDVH
jgi:hypothetical protein